jgi:hypothetical protein
VFAGGAIGAGGGGAGAGVGAGAGAGAGGGAALQPKRKSRSGNNPPGTTLFLGNLNHVSDDQLLAMVKGMKGCKEHKFSQVLGAQEWSTWFAVGLTLCGACGVVMVTGRTASARRFLR